MTEPSPKANGQLNPRAAVELQLLVLRARGLPCTILIPPIRYLQLQVLRVYRNHRIVILHLHRAPIPLQIVLSNRL